MREIFKRQYDPTMPIVFFDRDGVITKSHDFLLEEKHISFYTSAVKAIQLLNAFRFPIAIITNQPAVARGWITEKKLQSINSKIIQTLHTLGADISAIYSCPHHPNATLTQYRILCECRKPGSGFIRQAMQDLCILKTNGYIIGDKTSDIQTGKNSGLVTILVQTGYAGKDGLYALRPDYTFPTAFGAAKLIVSRHTVQERR